MSNITTDYTQLSQYNMYNVAKTNQAQQNNTLSSNQKSQIEEILSNYDSSSLTVQGAKTIVDEISQLGINPSQSLENFLDTLGFAAQEIGSLAQSTSRNLSSAMQGNMPPPPPQGVQDSILDTISELYEDEDSSTNSNPLNPYENSDLSISFSNSLDYTSRVLSLNKESRQEVFDLFDSYNNSDDKSSVINEVKNSLTDILTNKNNYGTYSLYV